VYSHNGIHIVQTTITDDTCNGKGEFWWPADDPDAKDMLAIALSAFMSGKNVQFVHDPDNPDCKFDVYNKATHIVIMD